MAVTRANLITLAPELAAVDTAILDAALAAVPLAINLTTFADKADLLTTYLALHILSLQGYGKQANGRIISKSAAGVSVTYAQLAPYALKDLDSTPWGALYRLMVRGYGLRGGVT